MNAANYKAISNFRKNVDIRQKLKHGTIDRRIFLPPDEFAYGLPNRPPTPMKNIMNNEYGNRSEAIIRNEYKKFIREKSYTNIKSKQFFQNYLYPKVNKSNKFGDNMHKCPSTDGYSAKSDRPLYKLKMFEYVGSKVAESLKQFKTYKPYKKIEKYDDNGLDHLIKKVEEEIKQKNDEKINSNEINEIKI
jgi:hypothetical protein